MPKKPQANKVRKVGLKLTPEQKNTILKWFGDYRYTYNWALSCIKENPKEYKKSNFYWLRNRFVNKCNIPKQSNFLLKTPKQIRANAIKELSQSYKTNFSILKTNPSHKFDLKFKTRKTDQCISIEKEAFKSFDSVEGEFNIFPSFIESRIKMNIKKNKIPKSVNYECKLLMDRLKNITMVIVYHESACDNQASCKHEWCAIDPGVRTLYTVYSPTPNIAYEIGKSDVSRLHRYCRHLDILISKTKTSTQKKRKLKAIIRLRKRIQNLVKEVHCKTVKFLVDNFHNIILPPFEVSKMVTKSKRKLNAKSVRQMLTWSHYKLKERLLYKSQTSGTNVFIKTEEWSSKTCTNCLRINHKLGGSKTYNCSNCHVVLDRDLNGARNIFMKNISAL